jgi:hypothetical protein
VLLEVDESIQNALAGHLSPFTSHLWHRDLQGHLRVLEARK